MNATESPNPAEPTRAEIVAAVERIRAYNDTLAVPYPVSTAKLVLDAALPLFRERTLRDMAQRRGG